jgi:hypothetical protein
MATPGNRTAGVVAVAALFPKIIVLLGSWGESGPYTAIGYGYRLSAIGYRLSAIGYRSSFPVSFWAEPQAREPR